MTILQPLTIIFISIILYACNGPIQQDKIVAPKILSINLDTLPLLKKIVDEIEKENSVESKYIGEGGTPSEQWKKFEQLKEVATIDQLAALTDHKNTAVRCYAFQALATKYSNKVFPILLDHLNDTAEVYSQSGCIGMTYYTGDYFVDVVTPNRIETDIYKLKPSEKTILDSILIYDKSIKLMARSWVLEHLQPTGEYYQRVRELVKEDKNGFALMALARYHKQSDKQLIVTFFSDENTQQSALYAVREFPDDYFYPFVKKVFEQEWGKDHDNQLKLRILYQALAKYPRHETLELFERTTKLKDEYNYQTHCRYLLLAITKYPNPLYESIKAKIKLNEYEMDEVTYELENDY